MGEIFKGFEPFYQSDAVLLILGSFPSVKSRQSEFYYGNKQNRFFKILAEFFGETTPLSVEEKKNFLSKHKIALWDMVTECEIVGSQDSSIKNYKVADIKNLLQKIQVRFIILNGGKARDIFLKYYGDLSVPYVSLPSTSPANANFSKEKWFDALRRVFE